MKTNRMLFSSRASASTSRAHLEAATTKARVNFETARAAESMGDEALAFGSSNVKGECVTRDVHFLSSLRWSRGLFLLARRVSENSEAPISPLKFEQQDFAATAAGAKVAPIAAEPSSVVQRSATVQWRELRRQMLNAPQVRAAIRALRDKILLPPSSSPSVGPILTLSHPLSLSSAAVAVRGAVARSAARPVARGAADLAGGGRAATSEGEGRRRGGSARDAGNSRSARRRVYVDVAEKEKKEARVVS